MFFKPFASNLNLGISHRFLQLGESVNIAGLVVARPSAPAAMCGIIAEDELKASRERKLFGDLAPAPAGDFGNAVNISSQPAGAV
jgi:hypothetical protein